MGQIQTKQLMVFELLFSARKRPIPYKRKSGSYYNADYYTDDDYDDDGYSDYSGYSSSDRSDWSYRDTRSGATYKISNWNKMRV